jgi:hypothetical protein
MTLADLFTWTQTSVFGNLRDPKAVRGSEIRRNLQQTYARMLAKMLLAPDPGVPFDAQSLARAELVAVRADAKHAASVPGNDALTQAHLTSLADIADRALSAQTVVPAMPAAAAGDAD